MNQDPKSSPTQKAPDDYAAVTGPGTVRLERLLPGPIERLWDYLTDSEKRGSWFAFGEMDLHVGGRVELIFHNSAFAENDDPPMAKYAEFAEESRMDGHITACDPPHVLAYTMPDSTGDDTEVDLGVAAVYGHPVIRVIEDAIRDVVELGPGHPKRGQIDRVLRDPEVVSGALEVTDAVDAEILREHEGVGPAQAC